MPKNDDHDSIARRLAEILRKLNDGKTLEPKVLAEEFKVSLRTIQRDLTQRFCYLPLKKEGGSYSLESYYLGKFTNNDIRQFAALSGIKGLFPSLEIDFLKSLLDATLSQAYQVKGHNYEDPKQYAHLFPPLEDAILGKRQVCFRYDGKLRTEVAPYKLLNYRGIWYLAAVDGGKLKSFRLAAIAALNTEESTFQPDATIVAQLAKEDSIWFSQEKREVVLKVEAPIAHFFQRRQLIPEQQIDKSMEDGSLIVSTRIANEAQILPIVRYWMPHIRIISPDSLQVELMVGIKEYMGKKLE